MSAGSTPAADPVGSSGAGGDLVRQERDVQARLGGLPIDPHALAAVSNVFRVANAVRLHMERHVLGADGISWTGFVVLWVLNTVFVIIAAIQASDGKFYRYPMTIRFIQ